jgi:polar amino acid transport system substrate-binding protein
MRLRRALIALPALTLAVAMAGCGSNDDKASDAPPSTSTAPTDSASETTAADQCSPANLQTKQAGQLTIATDSPAYDPWFDNNDPSDGKGYESAVAYAVANKLGYTNDQVKWVKEPFNNSYAPGAKSFDFDINEISITPNRAKVVDFSDPYYTSTQAVIVLKKSNISVGSIADLQGLQLGAQTGTTSLTALRDVIQPSKEPRVFNDSNATVQALKVGQVDGIVVDLPTAFYLVAAEIDGAEIAGQFDSDADPDQYGLLMEKGSPIKDCINQAIEVLQSDGTLANIENQWLSSVVNVPVLQ